MEKQIPIPRIRGRAGQAIEGEHKDKWFYEISIVNLTAEKELCEPMQIGPFDTEEIAKTEGKKAIKIVCDNIEKKEFGKTSGKYLDLNDRATLKKWEEFT